MFELRNAMRRELALSAAASRDVNFSRPPPSVGIQARLGPEPQSTKSPKLSDDLVLVHAFGDTEVCTQAHAHGAAALFEYSNKANPANNV